MEKTLEKWQHTLQKSSKQRIVFTEIFDIRVLTAASKLAEDKLLIPVVPTSLKKFTTFTEKHDINGEHFVCIDPQDEQIKQKLVPFLKKQDRLEDINLFSVLLVRANMADGLINGARSTTRDVIRPALSYLDLRHKQSRVSGAIIVADGKEKYLFADCSIHIQPNGASLAAIAIESVETAKRLSIDPAIAFISYTSHAQREDKQKAAIEEAMDIIRAYDANIPVDGELQFDAAFVPLVAQQKVPNSSLGGKATIFIFPTLEAGNIVCKMLEHMSPYRTFGPVTQGFSHAVHDLSRGCTVETIYEIGLYAAMQALDH